ncbi:MAG: hypothetical protein IH986_05435 [Planctomycetes bacterium]|nr:hypothetical protein [Planctomycetota bacterium]
MDSAVRRFFPFFWRPPEPTPEQLSRGHVWMLSGIEGASWPLQWAYRGLRDGGVDAAIRTFAWQMPFVSLANVVMHARNRRQAAELARGITAYRAQYPSAPVDLIGYSGGGGIAIMAAEALSGDVAVRNIILAQPAISRDYDLTEALHHVEGHVVNFHSRLDWFILGLGTLVLGTMDRRHSIAAGKGGFDLEQAVPEANLRAKVEQRPWDRTALRGAGHFGNHLSILRRKWNQQYVAPYLWHNASGGS